MRKYLVGALAGIALTTGASLALDAHDHEAANYSNAHAEAEANLLNEYRTQPPLGCVENADGSATCQDEQGGWHFEHSPW